MIILEVLSCHSDNISMNLVKKLIACNYPLREL